MRPDIKIKSEEGSFKFRVIGVVRYKDKFLLQVINDHDFYCFPGGHVELGEDTDSAIVREMKEEIPYKFGKVKNLTVIQNFFEHEGKVFHEVGYYYIIDIEGDIDTSDVVFTENDKGDLKTLRYKWVTIEQMQKEDVRPTILKSILQDVDATVAHIIFRDGNKV